MAVYNGERTLRQAIDSILAQTFQDFEFIVIDDHSKDVTYEILRSYCDPRLVIVRNSANLGQTPSLNVGCRLARADLIARMDADDYSYPERLARQWDYMSKNPEVAVLGTAGMQWDPNGKEIEVAVQCENDTEIYTMIFSQTVVIHVSAMIRRQVLAEVGLYDESYLTAQDFELWSRFLRRGKRIRNLADILVAYRADPRSYGRARSRTTLPEELARITAGNIAAFTHLAVAREQVRALVDVFATGGMALSEQEFHSALLLYASIFRNLRKEFRHFVANDTLVRSTLRECLARRSVVLIRKGQLATLCRHLLAGTRHPVHGISYCNRSFSLLWETLSRRFVQSAMS